jgi:hypothetical protein
MKRSYFNSTLECSRSIEREAKILIVNFVGTPQIQESYDVVVIKDFQEPNHISFSYDAPEALKTFRKWKQEIFSNLKLICKTPGPNGLYVKFSYEQIWDE